MSWLGVDFRRAKRSWSYPEYAIQHFWSAVGLSLFLFALNTILQLFLGGLIGASIFGLGATEFASGINPQAMQSILIAVFPAACIIVPLTLYLARFGMPDQLGRLPLTWPNLGVLGWALTIGIFIVIMYIVMMAIFAVSGLDPMENRGEVEKAISQVSGNKWLIIFIVPSLVLGASFVEELIFRGILFAGIKQTRLGAMGAVVMTSALWAGAHFGAAPFISVAMLFVMGLVLGIMLLRFGTLWVPIVAHALWNAMTAVVIFTIGG